MDKTQQLIQENLILKKHIIELNKEIINYKKYVNVTMNYNAIKQYYNIRIIDELKDNYDINMIIRKYIHNLNSDIELKFKDELYYFETLHNSYDIFTISDNLNKLIKDYFLNKFYS